MRQAVKVFMLGATLVSLMATAQSANAQFNSTNAKFKGWCYEFKNTGYGNLSYNDLLPAPNLVNAFENQCKSTFQRPTFHIKSGRDHTLWIGPEKGCEVSIQCEQADSMNLIHSIGFALGTNKSLSFKMYCTTKDNCQRK